MYEYICTWHAHRMRRLIRRENGFGKRCAQDNCRGGIRSSYVKVYMEFLLNADLYVFPKNLRILYISSNPQVYMGKDFINIYPSFFIISIPFCNVSPSMAPVV